MLAGEALPGCAIRRNRAFARWTDGEEPFPAVALRELDDLREAAAALR